MEERRVTSSCGLSVKKKGNKKGCNEQKEFCWRMFHAVFLIV